MRRTAGALVLLAATLLACPTDAWGQEAERGRFRLVQNYPDPFSPVTRIQFELDGELFADQRPAVVTLRVKDLLGRLIGTPLAADHPAGELPVEGLEYVTPGAKEALWDGTDRTGRKLPHGVYLLELIVNGERAPPIRLLVS